jgi:uncharacterized membrane protein YdbT with pleckstrin-like domain
MSEEPVKASPSPADEPKVAPKVDPVPAAVQLREKLESKSTVSEEQETSLWEGGYSPKAMFGTWIIAALLSIVVLILTVWMIASYFLWVFLAVLAGWAVLGCIYGYRRLGFQYELTTQRFIHQSGLLSRRTDRIEVIDIDDVVAKQGPIQRIFGVGTVVIESSDRSHPKLELKGIANVKDIAKMMDDVRRKERRRRAVHIEAI